jgi:hypothetical protein
MCSIGWKKLKDGYLLFKNRDRYPTELIKNRLIEDDLIVGFGDDIFPGLWFGINKKYNFAILTAWGPRDSKEPEEDFQVLENALRISTNAEKAADKFHELAHGNLKKPYNLIFADPEKALALEWTPQKHMIQEFTGMAVKTNDFSYLEEFNSDASHAQRSSARRKNLEYIFPTHKSPDELKSLLAYHSDENELANVCRHDYAQTIASVFAYVSKDEIKIYYSLNHSPDEHNYEMKSIKLKNLE